MDVTETLTVVCAIVAFLSFPIMLAIGGRLPRKAVCAVRLSAAALGVVLAAVCAIVFSVKVASASENVAGWARDFFWEYMKIAAPATAAVTLLLWLGNRLGTPAAFVRTALSVLTPAVLIMSGALCAGAASGGYFNVSAYIRAAGVALALVIHASCATSEKKS